MRIDGLKDFFSGVHKRDDKLTVIATQERKLSKAVNCSCGECLLGEDGKVQRRAIAHVVDDMLFARCLKCKGHTRLGKFEACEPPAPEPEKKINKSRVKIVYIPKQ